MMRGKESSEFQARHDVLSGWIFCLLGVRRLRAGDSEGNRAMSRAAECRHALVRGEVLRLPLPVLTGRRFHTVMAGLVPAIHALGRSTKNVDARDKPGHDEKSER